MKLNFINYKYLLPTINVKATYFSQKNMKQILLLSLIFISTLSCGQTSPANTKPNTSSDFLNHISVVAGAGITYGLNKVYEDPILEKIPDWW